MKNYFWEDKNTGEIFESPDPWEVASVIINNMDNNSKIKSEILNFIIEKYINEEEIYEDSEDSYVEAFNHYFDEGWEAYKKLIKE